MTDRTGVAQVFEYATILIQARALSIKQRNVRVWSSCAGRPCSEYSSYIFSPVGNMCYTTRYFGVLLLSRYTIISIQNSTDSFLSKDCVEQRIAQAWLCCVGVRSMGVLKSGVVRRTRRRRKSNGKNVGS